MDFYRQPLYDNATQKETLDISLTAAPEEREVVAKLSEAAVPMTDQRLADHVDLQLEHTATSDERAVALAKAAANIREIIKKHGEMLAQTGELHTNPENFALYRKLAVYTLGATNIDAVKKIHETITPAEMNALRQLQGAQIDELPLVTDETERTHGEQQHTTMETVVR